MKVSRIGEEEIKAGGELTLQLIRPFHADPCYRACQDPEIHRWLPLPWPYSRQFAEQWCARGAEQFREAGLGAHYAMVVAGEMIGCISLKNVRWKEDVVEIGYWLSAEARGRGHATRAVSALSNHAFIIGFERVELRVAEANTKSAAVAERAGFVYEGLLRSGGFTRGGRVDLRMYSLLMSDVFR